MEEVKEMKYKIPQEFAAREVLAGGSYNGYEYRIISYFTHPCAYVKLHENEIVNDADIDCHGGITYDSDGLIIDADMRTEQGRWIGWDYAHAYDYYADLPQKGGKQWTTAEILLEVKKVINQLKEVVR
nr:MAG TPA: hypothetical protein [Caudoviricetes sp.]